MLEWREEESDESNDSDNADDNDDDDRPSDNGFGGSKSSFQPPEFDPRGPSGSKHYGGGGGGSSGDEQSQGGFFQFQLSQLSGGEVGDQAPTANQYTRRRSISQGDQQHESNERLAITSGPETLACSLSALDPTDPKYVPTAGDDQISLAGDELSMSMNTEGQALLDVQMHSRDIIAKDVQMHPRETVAKELPADRTRLQLLQEQHSVEGLRSTTSSSVTQLSRAKSPHIIPQRVPSDSRSFLSVKLLGAGGFSTVDEVVHRGTNLRVGRKTLKNRDESANEELRKEVNVLQKLRHPHVIRFLGAYSKGDKLSILLSPVAETTLALWLERTALKKPAGLTDTVIKMFGCLASSVRYLHEQRPVVKHMDIKPQNILIVEGNSALPCVVLSDFGISSSEDHSQGRLTPITRQYIAPEVFNGVAREQAADIWSLGCVFSEMASVPFSEGNAAWLDFRKEFSGRTGKHYWQDIPGVQDRLSSFLEEATTVTEQTVVRTLKTMLSLEPTHRPDAASLTMIFTPAPCCLNWPNDKATFPGPQEELGGVEMLAHEGDVECHAQHHVHSERSEPSSDKLATLKSWLADCSYTHEFCEHQPSDRLTILPTRLVDVRPNDQIGTYVCVVDSAAIAKTTERVDYVALSHVWSPSEVQLSSSSMSEMRTELPLDALPAELNAAIATSQHLGYRYIWVDSLCIIQDSEQDKQHECASMANVFRNAALTVVLDQLTSVNSEAKASALITTDDIGGTAPLSSTSHTRSRASASLPAIDFSMPGFAWDTRAWSLQERLLSHRLLHLGEQMYWECNSLKASETFPRGLSPLVWEKVHSRSSEDIQAPLIGHRAAKSSLANTSTPEVHPPQLAPSRLRDCQWVKKEGDGIGDSMEAGQTTIDIGLKSTDAQLPFQPESTGNGNIFQCECNMTFTGTYRRGNLARHMRPHRPNTPDRTNLRVCRDSTPNHHHDIVAVPATPNTCNCTSTGLNDNGRKEIAIGGQLDQHGRNQLSPGVSATLHSLTSVVDTAHAQLWKGDASAKGLD